MTRRETAKLIALAALTAAVLAWVPYLGGVLGYPFRLLLTLVHELCHGLAALVTGGEFLRFVVYPDGSGLAYTAGGWRLVVIPAGYLGAAAFGAVLIATGKSAKAGRWALGCVGGAMVLFSLIYGGPTLFSGETLMGLLTVVSGLALGAAFLAVAARASLAWIVFTVHLVAIEAALAALRDLLTLIGLSTNAPETATDAQSMAAITLLPAVFWAVLWAFAALGMVGGAIWMTWLSSTNPAARGR